MNKYIKVYIKELPEEFSNRIIIDSIMDVIEHLEKENDADFVQYFDFVAANPGMGDFIARGMIDNPNFFLLKVKKGKKKNEGI